MPFGGESAESYYDEGLTASMKGRLNEAAECFENAIRKDASMASAYQQLGRTYSRLGKHNEAVKLLKQVVAKRGDQAIPLIDLGNALIGAQRHVNARECFDRALAQDPTNAKAILGLAQADFDEGNWRGALQHAQQALTVAGATYPTLSLLARAAQLAGEPDTAARSFEKADKLLERYIKMNPEQPEGHYLRSELALHQQKFSQALDESREAERRAAWNRAYIAYGEAFSMADILAKQGLSLQGLDEVEAARTVGARIVEKAPDHRIGKALANIEKSSA